MRKRMVKCCGRVLECAITGGAEYNQVDDGSPAHCETYPESL